MLLLAAELPVKNVPGIENGLDLFECGECRRFIALHPSQLGEFMGEDDKSVVCPYCRTEHDELDIVNLPPGEE